jgi:hypothetical protein
MWSGKDIPGNKTVFSGKRGSSTISNLIIHRTRISKTQAIIKPDKYPGFENTT